MKKDKAIIALAATAGAVGVAAIAYSLLKKDIPKGATAVESFDINRYLGKWYELARMPSMIEKDLDHLTEEYSYDDNNFKVVTKAYNNKTNEWKEATGKIKFAGKESVGKLKVSYFRPVYFAYNILDLDVDYKYALVSGSGLDYLWVLSKDGDIPNDIKNQFLRNAAAIGFDVAKLEWPRV